MAKSLMELIHKDMVISDSEVGMGVASELVVSKYHLSNAAHQPLSLVHWAHSVSVSVKHSDWCLGDVAKRDVGGDSLFLTDAVAISKLLESVFDTVLEEVSQGLGGEWLLLPDSLLLAPHAAKMSTDLRLVLLPVLTKHGREANHVDVVIDVLVIVVTCGASEDVHLSAWGKKNCSSQVVMEQLVLFVSESIEKGSGSLIVADVNNLIWVSNEWLLYFLGDDVLDMLEHGWGIVHADLSE